MILPIMNAMIVPLSFSNLPFFPFFFTNSIQETVRATFGECGDIKSVRFAEDRETGEFRGFGHVEFYDGSNVDAAMALASTDVMGRPIRVSLGVCLFFCVHTRDKTVQVLLVGINRCGEHLHFFLLEVSSL